MRVKTQVLIKIVLKLKKLFVSRVAERLHTAVSADAVLVPLLTTTPEI